MLAINMVQKNSGTEFSFLISQDGWTALIAACKEGHYEVVKELMENGAKVQLPDLVSSVYLNHNITSDQDHCVKF